MSQKHIFPKIDDDFFKKGNTAIKLWQSILAILSWLILLSPFFWIFMTIYNPFDWHSLHFFHFRTEVDTIHFLSYFLGISFCVILIHHVIMSIRVNHFIKRMSEEKDYQTMHRIALRNQKFDDIFDERFGSKEFRHNVKFFNVDSGKNFEKKYLFRELRLAGKEK